MRDPEREGKSEVEDTRVPGFRGADRGEGITKGGAKKYTLIYGNPLSLELANSDERPCACPPASAYFSHRRRVASDEIWHLPHEPPLMPDAAILIARETRGKRLAKVSPSRKVKIMRSRNMRPYMPQP